MTKTMSYNIQHHHNNVYMMFNSLSLVSSAVRDIKTKIQSFRTSVSREMSKISRWKNDAGPNDIYKPSYAHWNELQFLTAVIKKRDPASDVVRFCYLLYLLKYSSMSMTICLNSFNLNTNYFS